MSICLAASAYLHTGDNTELRRPWYEDEMSTKILDMVGTHLAATCLADGTTMLQQRLLCAK